MMHIYVCANCKKAYMISRRKQASCKRCGGYMIYCPMEFNEWVEKTDAQRRELIENMCMRTH